jgi:hypothetical protein
MKTIARWILCIPAAGLAATVTSMVIGSLAPLTMGRFEADPDRLFTALAQGVGMGVVFVAVGTSVAPRKRNWIPFGLAGLTAILLGTILLPAIQASRWIDLTSFGMMVGAAFATAWHLQRQDEPAPTPTQEVDEDRPKGRVLQAADGSWSRISSRRTANMHRVDLVRLVKKDGKWVDDESPHSSRNPDAEHQFLTGNPAKPPHR